MYSVDNDDEYEYKYKSILDIYLQTCLFCALWIPPPPSDASAA